MGRWAYGRLMSLALTIATLTVVLAVASMTVFAPGQLAGAARQTLADPVGAKAATESLTGILEGAGLEAGPASEAAAVVVNDPALAAALERAEVSGDMSALPEVLAAALTPYSGSAAADLPAKIAKLIEMADRQGVTDPSQLDQLDLTGLDLHSESASVAPGLAAADTLRGMPVAGPSFLGGHTSVLGWVQAHDTLLIGLGTTLSAGLALLTLALAGRRRMQTVRLVGRWALITGGLPLLVLYVVLPLVPDSALSAGLELARVTIPKLLDDAVPLWVVLAGAGLAAVVAGRAVPLLGRDTHARRAPTRGSASPQVAAPVGVVPAQREPQGSEVFDPALVADEAPRQAVAGPILSPEP